MWQQSKTEAQGASLTAPLPSQKQALELALHTDEKRLPLQADVFRKEALQHYISQKREPVSPINMTMRFSLLLWLALAILLLSLVVLGILLVVFAGVPVLGLGKEIIAI